jgi:hypothetical protein
MSISPQLLHDLDELARKDFQVLRDWYFYALTWCTAMVAIGVVAEEFEDIFKLRWLRRIIPTNLLLPIHRLDAWAGGISKAGWVLIILGVAGEGLFEAWVSRADGWLQEFNNTILVTAQRQAADAMVEAAGASERAGIANKEAGMARLDASNANVLAKKYEAEIAASDARAKSAEALVASASAASADAVAKVSTAEARIAEAQRGAAEAQRAAEAERLERVRLEAIVAPRSISLVDQMAITVALLRFSGRRVSVTTYSLDGEGAVLGQQVIATLQGARIEVDNRIASMMPLGGFAFGVHVTGTGDALVAALRGALSGIGHLAVAPPNAQMGGGAAIGTGPQNPAAVDADVLIGIKPVPTIAG